MRIKSYFAASVQAAIGMARQEFGERVTLVTSHVAGPDARQLGQYEVVFAVEDLSWPVPKVEEPEPGAPERAPAPAKAVSSEPAAFNDFQQLLLAAVQSTPPVAATEKLERIREALIDVGLEAAMASAVVTLVEKSLEKSSSATAIRAATRTPAAGSATASDDDGTVVSIQAGCNPQHLSAAELSFISAVSGSPGAPTVPTR